MSETAARKDVQKLQRVIVDALEDVKAQDIQVFNTEHLSPLFERVIMASGMSNRQTKALSASVRDKVREAGFGKPRIEGEDNGEWIIADCGQAVVHIMQPVIRQYYNLEEIWGDKPVRLKFGAPRPEARPVKAGRKPATGKTSAKSLTPRQAASAARTAGVQPAGRTAGSTAGKSGASQPAAKKTALRAPARKTPASPKAPPVKKLVVNAPARPTAKSAGAQKPAAKTAAAKTAAAKTAAANSAPARRPAARKKSV
jgi:ribosome-associated protein